jgi:glycosyltransferase involved in cell wall biosynthesis
LTPETTHTPEDILCISFSFWDGPKRVRHNLMREYVKRGHRVLFVEAALTWIKLLKGFQYWKQGAQLFSGVRQSPDGVMLAMVPPFFPGGEWIEWISRLNWWMVRVWLKIFILPSLNFKAPRLFLFAPHAGPLIGQFQESVSIYFCNDPFAELFQYGSARPNLQRMEDTLTRKAQIVFAVSEKLLEERRRHNANSHLIPLAADVDLFMKAVDKATQVPSDLQVLPRPIAGHVGVINTRLDIEFVRNLARLLPEASFVFIGPIIEVGAQMRDELLGLQKCNNVFFLGNKAEEQLPSYFKGIDVCIVPYLRDDVTKYIKANSKFYQAVASGCPVVSTIGPFGLDEDIVRPADTPQQFVEAIRKALAPSTPEQQKKRLGFAQQNSWKERVDRIERLLSATPRRGSQERNEPK